MLRFLVVNDDSFRSALLGELVHLLAGVGEVTVVVPEHEQSWRGKCVSRFEDVRVQEREIYGARGLVLNGSPADCANIAIHDLCEHTPDLVVSGINAGMNAGAGFVFSSGTVGACWEANIAGVPAVAVSQRMDADGWIEWKQGFGISKSLQSVIREVSGPLLVRFIKELIADSERLKEIVTWNVNLPLHVHEMTAVQSSVLAHDFYGSLFRRVGDEYVFDLAFDSIERDTREVADYQVVQAGHVSVTKLDLRSFGQDIG